MMGRKAKELEAMLQSRDNEITQLKQSMYELNATIAQYRTNESAIAGVLMRAQTAATGIIKDAENERDKMLSATRIKKDESEREAAEAVEKAKQQAQKIIDDAKHRAELIENEARENEKATVARMEGFMADYRANASKINDEIKRVAAEAAKYAQEFSRNAGRLDLDAAIGVAEEYKGTAAAVADNVQGLPEDYTDPRSLIHSIYTIEHREAPDEHENTADAGAASHAETATDAKPAQAETATEPAAETAAEPAAETAAKPLTEPVDGDAPVSLDPFRSWSNTADKSTDAAVDLTQPEDEHVWTVEEVVERTNADENASIDDELNAIIEDLLKDS